MRIEKFSLKALTVSVLLVVGIVAVAFSFVSESEYRKAAVQSQTRAVARILDVATDAALTRLELDSDQLAAAAVKAIGRQPGLGTYLAEAPAGTANPTLAKLLEATLNTNLPNLRPLSVRLYNRDRQPLMGAGQGEIQDSPLLADAAPEQPAAGLWLAEPGPRYSVIRTLGEKSAAGYLEIRFDPVVSLQSVAELTDLPLRMHSLSGTVLFEAGEWQNTSSSVHEVSLQVHSSDGSPLMALVVLDDFADYVRAQEAVDAGAELFTETLVEDLLWEEGRVLVPCGLRWSPPVPAEVVGDLFDLLGGERVLLLEEGAARLPESALAPASRRAVRAAAEAAQ